MRKKIYGKRAIHADMAHVFNNIGAEYNNLKNKVEAIYYAQKAKVMQEKLFNDDHPDLIETYENLSASYSNSKALDEEISLKYALDAYKMQARLFPNVDHPRTARLLLRIGKSYANLATLQRLSNNKQLYIDYVGTSINEIFKANEMQRRIFYDRAHPDFAETLQSLGESYRKKNELDESLRSLNKNETDRLEKLIKEMEDELEKIKENKHN